ncbi:sulfotransferase family protein [Botrimarina mediterranea]|nr:sulfotransferase family protein [Botrimarina mediterranea]
MQMIAAGGVEPLTDGERAADIDNPRGYFELDAVKRLKADSSCIRDGRGKVVKVISHLLGELPSGETYRIVFVDRDLDEILTSQAKMIARLGKPAPPQDIVRRAFVTHLDAFERLTARRQDYSVLRVAYTDMVAEPQTAAERIAGFLAEGGITGLDLAAMAGTVDPNLYRNRAKD